MPVSSICHSAALYKFSISKLLYRCCYSSIELRCLCIAVIMELISFFLYVIKEIGCRVPGRLWE